MSGVAELTRGSVVVGAVRVPTETSGSGRLGTTEGGFPKIVAENCTAVHPLGKVFAMNAQALSAHVLQALARAQSEGRAQTLETLTQELGVRRGDVRHVITRLHGQGFVDALRMRLTLPGFALGRAYLARTLPPLRMPTVAEVVAA